MSKKNFTLHTACLVRGDQLVYENRLYEVMEPAPFEGKDGLTVHRNGKKSVLPRGIEVIVILKGDT